VNYLILLIFSEDLLDPNDKFTKLRLAVVEVVLIKAANVLGNIPASLKS